MDFDLKATIEGILSQTFLEESPIQIDPANAEHAGKRIHSELNGISYLKLDTYRHRMKNYPKDRKATHVYSFSLDHPMEFYHQMAEFSHFTIELNEQHNLELVYGATIYKISSFDELVALGRACQQIAERLDTRAKQIQRVRGLKSQAILAHVKQLANKYGYTYAADYDDRSDEMNLYIQVHWKMLRMTLPYDRYPDFLEMIEPTILTVQKLFDKEIKFSLRSDSISDSEFFSDKWVTPESLAKAK
ncbi:MAG: hypothetical protein AAF639_38705 [Chloroflexota bacterium]